MCTRDVDKDEANSIDDSSRRTEAIADHVNDGNDAGQNLIEAPQPAEVVLDTEQLNSTKKDVLSLAKAPQSAAGASKESQRNEAGVPPPRNSQKSAEAGSMEGHATTPLLAEAKSPENAYRESKKAQAKRQRAAREAAYREAAPPIGQNGGAKAPMSAWQARPRIPINEDMPYHVVFSVRLGSAVHRRIFIRSS